MLKYPKARSHGAIVTATAMRVGYLVSRYFFKIIDMILVLVLFAVSIILSFSFAGQKMTNQTWTNVDL